MLSARVSVPGIGTFPDSSPLTRVAPVPIPLENGGGVEIFDPDGKRLAATGAQAKAPRVTLR